MNYRLGYQTIIWGPQIDDLEGVLDVICKAGYEGVEIAQRPTMIRMKGKLSHVGIDELCRLLEERDLSLLGFAGGTLEERLSYCGSVLPEYLYVEDWDPQIAPLALKRGFTLGLHPHVYKKIHRLSDALDLLEEQEGLKFILDTAHLVIVGDDPVKAVGTLGKDRLLAVHLKDWSPEFGRASHRYARGFIELGQGVVDFLSVFEELKAIEYAGWLVVEQDTTGTGAQASILNCAQWLDKHGLMNRKPENLDKTVHRSRGPFPDQRQCDPGREIKFVRSLVGANGQPVHKCYRRVASAIAELVPSHLVMLSGCSPANDLMTVLAVHPPITLPRYTCRLSEALSSIAIERQTVTTFDLDATAYPSRTFQLKEIKDRLGLKRMICIPIFNPSNHNHMRLLAHVFPRDTHYGISEEELLWFGMDVGRSVDIATDEISSVAGARANLLADESTNRKGFLERLIKLILEMLSCEAVTILLVNEARDKLEVAATTGVEWHALKNDEFYRKGEGLTGTVWSRNEPLLATDVTALTHRAAKCIDKVKSKPKSHLIAPLVDSCGEVVGVLRCRNKQGATLAGFNMFSEDDLAIVDAIAQAALPHLQVRMAEERHRKAVGRITHELKTPIMAIRGATEMAQRRIDRLRNVTPTTLFGYDYLDDIWSWSELARRWIGNADFFRYSDMPIPVQQQRVRLMADVIAPAVRQVRPLLEDRGFSSRGIHYDAFSQVPPLYVDKNLFQQVIFNLLSNSIKYAFDDARAFEVTISGQTTGSGYLIQFADTGTGIEEGTEERIFEDGFRGRKAIEKDATGQGFGLWVVRQALAAHGATIEVTKNQLPTIFDIRLPQGLASRPTGHV